MEATLPLQRRSVSFPWTWTVGGAIAGVVFVVAVILLDALFMHGESMASYLLLWPTVLMLRPAQHIFQLFGWHWDWISLGPWGHIPVFPILVVFVTNAVIFAAIGSGIGFALKIARR